MVLHAVLTFPLGIAASIASATLIYTGFATPIEAIFVATPIHAALGYLQWYKILPAVHRNTP
jgi:hypothetical protein